MDTIDGGGAAGSPPAAPDPNTLRDAARYFASALQAVQSVCAALTPMLQQCGDAVAPLARWYEENREWIEQARRDEPPEEQCVCMCGFQHRTGVCAGTTDRLTGRRVHFDTVERWAWVCAGCYADRRGLLLAVLEHTGQAALVQRQDAAT